MGVQCGWVRGCVGAWVWGGCSGSVGVSIVCAGAWVRGCIGVVSVGLCIVCVGALVHSCNGCRGVHSVRGSMWGLLWEPRCLIPLFRRSIWVVWVQGRV